MPEPCIHELDPRTCSVCSGRDNEPAPDRANYGPFFAARYPGKCVCCGEWFGEGAQIRADGESGYLCEACGGERRS